MDQDQNYAIATTTVCYKIHRSLFFRVWINVNTKKKMASIQEDKQHKKKKKRKAPSPPVSADRPPVEPCKTTKNMVLKPKKKKKPLPPLAVAKPEDCEKRKSFILKRKKKAPSPPVAAAKPEVCKDRRSFVFKRKKRKAPPPPIATAKPDVCKDRRSFIFHRKKRKAPAPPKLAYQQAELDEESENINADIKGASNTGEAIKTNTNETNNPCNKTLLGNNEENSSCDKINVEINGVNNENEKHVLPNESPCKAFSKEVPRPKNVPKEMNRDGKSPKNNRRNNKEEIIHEGAELNCDTVKTRVEKKRIEVTCTVLDGRGPASVSSGTNKDPLSDLSRNNPFHPDYEESLEYRDNLAHNFTTARNKINRKHVLSRSMDNIYLTNKAFKSYAFRQASAKNSEDVSSSKKGDAQVKQQACVPTHSGSLGNVNLRYAAPNTYNLRQARIKNSQDTLTNKNGDVSHKQQACVAKNPGKETAKEGNGTKGIVADDYHRGSDVLNEADGSTACKEDDLNKRGTTKMNRFLRRVRKFPRPFVTCVRAEIDD